MELKFLKNKLIEQIFQKLFGQLHTNTTHKIDIMEQESDFTKTLKFKTEHILKPQEKSLKDQN